MRYLSGGESHGPCLTGIIEGLPAGLEITSEAINRHLARRRRGFGRGGRMAIEDDRVEFLSGLRFNLTLGSPLTLRIINRDWENWRMQMSPEGGRPPGTAPVSRPRPGHADLAGGAKYAQEDLRNILERSSARETAVRTAVGSVARRLLEHFGIAVYSHVLAVGPVTVPGTVDDIAAVWEQVESSPLRCADPQAGEAMQEAVEKARNEGDTLGGVFEVIVTGLPPGLGSHVHWDRRLDGRLAGAVGSIQGIKGVEFGKGFASAAIPGSKLHDPISRRPGGGITRPSNRAGGLEGGITNGQTLVVRAAMKPIPTLTSPIGSVDLATGNPAPAVVERSDVCAVPSAAVVAEAVVAWELAAAFREKFAGDFMEEVEASYAFYRQHLRRYFKEQ